MTAEHIPTDNSADIFADTSPNKVSIEAVSENAILLTWPEVICPSQHQQIIRCQNEIKSQLGDIIFETVPAYHSLMIYYHFQKISLLSLLAKLGKVIEQITKLNPDSSSNNKSSKNSQSTNHTNNIIEIPVYYGEDAGWDLHEVAQRCRLSIDDVIHYHSQNTYHAYALGFTPGFCYLGSVHNKLVLPRKDKPRLNIPKGAVAIAKQQSAIYPNNSPGGWHILGQTPMPMYTTTKQAQHSHFQAAIGVGQQVKFKPITLEEFINLGGSIEYENKHKNVHKDEHEHADERSCKQKKIKQA